MTTSKPVSAWRWLSSSGLNPTSALNTEPIFSRRRKVFFSPKLFFSCCETSQARWAHLKVGKEVLKSRLGKKIVFLSVTKFWLERISVTCREICRWWCQDVTKVRDRDNFVDVEISIWCPFYFHCCDWNLDLVVQGTYETFWGIFVALLPHLALTLVCR